MVMVEVDRSTLDIASRLQASYLSIRRPRVTRCSPVMGVWPEPPVEMEMCGPFEVERSRELLEVERALELEEIVDHESPEEELLPSESLKVERSRGSEYEEEGIKSLEE